MRFLFLFLLTGWAWAQTLEYERTTMQIPVKGGSPRAAEKEALEVRGATVLLGDAQGNGVYRLPDLRLAYRLPAGVAHLGAREVALYRQGALEFYREGKLVQRRQQAEPLWFGQVGQHWVVVSRQSVEVGPRRIPIKKLDRQAQVFGVWFENDQLHLSTTDSQGSTYLTWRLSDGKQIPAETVRGDISIQLASDHFMLHGEYNHPGDAYTHLSQRPHQSVLSGRDYFPKSLSEGDGRAAYLLEINSERFLEVIDPKANQRWTWEGPPAAQGALSGDGKWLVVLGADGKVYVQSL
ncbi:MAG: hypothetical protein U0931_24660 [Vulcanimicrobiota bacterium]